MHFCIVYKEDYPWDVRVEKIAQSLYQDGHRVTIVCRNLDQKERFETIDGIAIRRLPRTDKFPKFISRIVNVPLWFNPFWLWAILQSAPRSYTSTYIVRDLPLILAGVICSWFKKNRVIFDMAECYPEMYASGLKFSEQQNLRRFVKSPALAAIYERLAINLVAHVFVMIEESRDRLLRMGVSAEKITIVSNTPPVEKFSGRTAIQQGEQLRLVYVGFLTRLRGLDVLIRAIRLFIDKTGNSSLIKLDIVGKGAARDELINLVEELKLKSNVTVHGWLEQRDVDNLLDQANIGALTYRVCSHWNHTIPNKIFDYMLAGLPVLTTDVIPISRIVNDADCGIVCKDQDPRSIATALVKLCDPSTRARLGSNGHQAILEEYNWQNDKIRLTSRIAELHKP